MPFTPAHSAIVFPLLRGSFFSATALIKGSLAPDFEYFLTMNVQGKHGHTLAGIFYFDLPVVFFLSLVFHLVVKRNLILNLPIVLQLRLQDTLRLDFIDYLKKHYLVFIFSAILGSASHIFWDGFTHHDGFFAQSLAYTTCIIDFNFFQYPLHGVLQHVSTLLGLTAIFFYIKSKKREPLTYYVEPKMSYWLLLIAIVSVIIIVRFSYRDSLGSLPFIVINIISAFLIGSILLGLTSFKNINNQKY